MRRPAALYDIRHLLTAQLPQLPGRLRAVLALWVEGTLLGLNGCQDTVTLALAHGLRGPRNPHTLRRLQRELLYDDTDRHPGGPRSWGPGQELEVERGFAPLLQWVRRGWVPTGGREMAQEPRVLAADPRPQGPPQARRSGGAGDQCGLSPARHSRCLAHRGGAGKGVLD